MTTLQLKFGDCVERIAELPDGSVGAVVSDPPYGLRFMGKEFDDLGDGSAQREWHRAWVNQAFRVIRPGGVIKAFCGTRTFHHLAAVIREAGFTDIRIEAWAYGSGFPKSLNIGKAIDKQAGAAREVVGTRISAFGDADNSESSDGRNLWCKPATKEIPLTGGPASDLARTWDGWGTALKPSWEPVIIGRKPL